MEAESIVKKNLSKNEAEILLKEGEKLNPGRWIAHSRTVGYCAERIAKHCGMDAEKAYVMGLLHDIGRREGIMDMKHIYCGYRYMMSEGDVDTGRICLTHSFPYQDIASYSGQNDCTEEETDFIRKYLKETEYDDYDRLIQLCDALAFPEGPVILEKRLVDVTMRRGFNDLTLLKWKAFFELREYFNQKSKRDIYEVIEVHL